MKALKISMVVLAAVSAAGCAAMLDNSRFYDGTIQYAQGRSPDDYPFCPREGLNNSTSPGDNSATQRG